jgi:flagellar basal-body rod protein FlgC
VARRHQRQHGQHQHGQVSTDDDAFQERFMVAQEAGEGNGGVFVAGAALGMPKAASCTRPSIRSPMRTATCATRHRPGEQMSNLIMAQRGYQANAAVVDRAKESYQAALQIGRN